MQSDEEKKIVEFQDLHAMDPITKYEKLNEFPYKMIIHILLLVLTTCQVVLIVSDSNKYSRAQERFLYNMFIDNSDKRDVDYHKIAYLYTAEEIKAHFIRSVNNFYNLNSHSLEIVQMIEENPILVMDTTYIDYSDTPTGGEIFPFDKRNVIPRKFEYTISRQDYGPFSYPIEDVRELLNEVIEFRLNYTLKTYVPFYYKNNFDCNLWSIIQHYNFASRAHFIVKLSIDRFACQDYTGDNSFITLFINKLLWLHVVVFILSLISLVLTWKYIQKIANFYMRVKTKQKQKLKGKDQEYDHDVSHSKSDDSIYYNPLLDMDIKELDQEEEARAANTYRKMYMDDNASIYSRYKDRQGIPKSKKKDIKFDMWSMICLIGNVIQLFASAISVFDTEHIMAGTEILIGFGCLFAYLNIGRYIEFAKNYSTIYVTIQLALPNVMRYLIGVSPIFLGFIFFGLCIFWRSERFTSTSDVMIILFALAQGDSVFDAFKDLSGFYFFLGQVYLYLFCIIFIV